MFLGFHQVLHVFQRAFITRYRTGVRVPHKGEDGVSFDGFSEAIELLFFDHVPNGLFGPCCCGSGGRGIMSGRWNVQVVRRGVDNVGGGE